MTVELEVVAAAILEDGLVLACRRGPDKAAAGRWEFPGGKVEGDEDPATALKRELLEELGVDIEVGDLLDRSKTRVGDLIIDLATYHARLIGPRPHESTDHDRLEWISLGELPSLEWADPDLPAVAALADMSTATKDGESKRV